ncbi:hypothetical protein QLX08_004710 [Tetragonisca angustula]|uniref:Uncharacterized protein n=1 Tax=Tetragonisca angustula TaxID=166442 RepID=A0AAW1A1G7_9HYME
MEDAKPEIADRNRKPDEVAVAGKVAGIPGHVTNVKREKHYTHLFSTDEKSTRQKGIEKNKFPVENPREQMTARETVSYSRSNILRVSIDG